MPTSPDTSSQSTRQSVSRFGDCEFDELGYQLRVRGQVVELERKPLEVLRYLLSKPGEVVGKEELLEAEGRSGAAVGVFNSHGHREVHPLDFAANPKASGRQRLVGRQLDTLGAD
jgi:hypothetical protein